MTAVLASARPSAAMTWKCGAGGTAASPAAAAFFARCSTNSSVSAVTGLATHAAGSFVFMEAAAAGASATPGGGEYLMKTRMAVCGAGSRGGSRPATKGTRDFEPALGMALRRALQSAARVSDGGAWRMRSGRRTLSLECAMSQATAVALPAGALALWVAGIDVRETSAYSAAVSHVVMPVLRRLDPETAHGLAVRAAGLGLAPREPPDVARAADNIAARFGGRTPPSVIGLAAGFDKQGDAIAGLLCVGFGSVEVGSITPLPQPGNPRPRMFRLPADRAVINRFGFNSDGLAAVIPRIALFMERRRASALGELHPRELLGEVGLNIGKNKEGDAVLDYAVGIAACAPFADYLVINVSSPNTPGLRALQAREQLVELVSVAKRVRDELPWGVAIPPWSSKPTADATAGRGITWSIDDPEASAGMRSSDAHVSLRRPDWEREREHPTPTDASWSEWLLRSRGWDARTHTTGSLATLALHLLSHGHGWRPDDEAAIANRWWRGLASRRLPPPLFVKIAPDLTDEQVDDIVATAKATGIDGIIVSNTTVARPSALLADPALTAEAGGLSGAPLMEPSTKLLAKLFVATGGALPLIGALARSCVRAQRSRGRATPSLPSASRLVVHSWVPLRRCRWRLIGG